MTNTRSVDRGLPDAAHVVTAAGSALSDRPGRALAPAYEETHSAILAILDGRSDGQLSTVIPACPAWTVRDLVAHMTGVAADAVAARFPVVNPHGAWTVRQPIIDAFTAGQVQSRRGMALHEVLAVDCVVGARREGRWHA